MEGTYYQNPTFPNNNINYSNNSIIPNDSNFNNPLPDIPMQQSYIENILRHNKGKNIKASFSFPDSQEWKDKIFTGTIEQAGKDHLIIKNPETNQWFLIPLIYLNYVEFDEKIEYSEKGYIIN